MTNAGREAGRFGISFPFSGEDWISTSAAEVF
jgi:hypothetical protein